MPTEPFGIPAREPDGNNKESDSPGLDTSSQLAHEDNGGAKGGAPQSGPTSDVGWANQRQISFHTKVVAQNAQHAAEVRKSTLFNILDKDGSGYIDRKGMVSFEGLPTAQTLRAAKRTSQKNHSAEPAR